MPAAGVAWQQPPEGASSALPLFKPTSHDLGYPSGRIALLLPGHRQRRRRGQRRTRANTKAGVGLALTNDVLFASLGNSPGASGMHLIRRHGVISPCPWKAEGQDN